MTISGKIAFGSLGVSLIVVIIKGAAYLLTGSVALLSDALESVINVATAIAAIIAIRYAAQPADEQHPYGHQKAEYLSAVVIGVMIVLAGLAILQEAYQGVLAPKPIGAPLLGLGVSSIATVVNAVWSTVLIRQGRSHHSPSLIADVDAVIAALVALHVLWSGWEVIRESSGGLLDEAVPEEELQLIHQVISANSGEAIQAQYVRTRFASRTRFIDFHLVVPRLMT